MGDSAQLLWGVTALGESTILLATALLAALLLLVSGQKWLAAASAAAVLGCAGSMAVLKVAFLTCGHLVLDATVRSPSGHTAMATIFYGVVAVTVRTSCRRWLGNLLLLLAGSIAAAVGVSRVLLDLHTPEEVLVGLVVALFWLVLFAVVTRRLALVLVNPHPAALASLALVYGGLLVASSNGQGVPVEGMIWRLAMALQAATHVCLS